MNALRHLIIIAVVALLTVPQARAQSATGGTPDGVVAPRPPLRLTVTFPAQGQRLPVAAAMHPAAKGAMIGAAAGAGALGAFGLWYCTIGPSESGDCTRDHWSRAIPLYVFAIGAGVGALIGALR